jgi:hypothetical protein
MVRVFVGLGVVSEADAPTLLTVATGQGKGKGRTLCDCGALSAAVLVISAVFVPRVGKPKRMYRVTGTFSKRFRDAFGSPTCRELRKQCAHDCRAITCRTAAMLAEFITQHARKYS